MQSLALAVYEREMILVQEINTEKSKVAKLEAEKYTDWHTAKELQPIRAEVAELRAAMTRLMDQVAFDRERSDCRYVPQEKGFMDGRRVNYHGVVPELQFREDFRRGDRDGCGCDGFHRVDG